MDKSCDNCKYSSLSEDDSPCNECTHCYTSEWQPQTNADRIRAMSDEELAELTLKYDEGCGCFFCSDGESYYDCGYGHEKALQHEIYWLKSPTND